MFTRIFSLPHVKVTGDYYLNACFPAAKFFTNEGLAAQELPADVFPIPHKTTLVLTATFELISPSPQDWRHAEIAS
jgi:hypothetical protein